MMILEFGKFVHVLMIALKLQLEVQCTYQSYLYDRACDYIILQITLPLMGIMCTHML